MMQKTYNEIKALENRILQLEHVLDYWKSLASSEPFSLKIQVSSFNRSVSAPIIDLGYTSRSVQGNSDDIKDIIDFIETRLKKLKTEFADAIKPNN